MNINFSTIKFSPNYINANYAKPNISATNPIASKQTNLNNEINFSGVSSNPLLGTQTRIQKLSAKAYGYITLLTELERQYEAGKIQQTQYNRELKGLNKKIADTNKKIAELQNETDKIREFRKRKNAAFIYSSKLTPEEKEAEVKEHPEFKTLDQIAQEAGNPKLSYGGQINRYFMTDNINGVLYIDTSYEDNKENYQALLQNSKGKITISDFIRRTGLSRELIKSLTERGAIESFALTDVYNGQAAYTDLIPEATLTKVENIKTLIPKQSQYYKEPERNPEEPLYVPIRHLSELGYGTPKQIYKMCKDKHLKGIERVVEQDGERKKEVRINIASPTAEANLKRAKEKNKTYLTISELASQLKVSRGEIERAVIDGELVANNQYLFSNQDEYQSGVCLYKTKNRQYIEKFAFVELAKTEVLEENKSAIGKLPKLQDSKQKDIFGLQSKIAWYLAPNTREIASNLAYGDELLARIIAKEKRIRAAKGKSETTEKLTEFESIALSEYRKALWKKAGKQEFSEASKQARKLVNLYVNNGIDAISDPEIKSIIKEYMS